MAQLQTKTHREKTETADLLSADAVSALDMRKIAHLNDRTLEAARRFGAAMLDGMARMNREFMQFMATRMQEDLRAVGSLADCRDPADFVRAEFRFLQVVVRNYADGTSRMLAAAAALPGAARTEKRTAASEPRRAFEDSAV